MKLLIWLSACIFQFQFISAEITKLAHGEGYLYPYPKNCSDILKQFSLHASSLTRCSIDNARPIRLCEKCIKDFVLFRDQYTELMQTVVNGTSCRSVFISEDRLEVVLEYHENILAIWNKGNCNACYYWSNGSDPQPTLSNETKLFNKMYNNTMDCITENINPYANNSEEVCEKCLHLYVGLDSYYNTLSTDQIGVEVICMDIIDKMNATRSIWSKTLNCCNLRKKPEIMFLCCTAIISLLPFLFYIFVRFCGPMRDLPNVLKQSRFSQIISRSVHGTFHSSTD